MSRLYRLLLIVALLATISAAPAQVANALYIAPTGSDTNPCTLASPCLTLPVAWGRATAGTTIYARSGVYYSRGEWVLSGKNTITVTAYPADIVLGYEFPIIDATYAGLGPTDNVLLVSNSQTVTVSRLEIRNSSGRGVSTYGTARNVTLYRLTVHHIGERCIGLVGSYITLDSSNVYECALNWKAYTGAGGWPGGVSTWWKSGTTVRSDHIAVINSLIQRVYGEGLVFLHADAGSALNVVIYDSKSVNLYIDDAIDITVTDLLVNNTDPAFYKSGRAAHCVELGNEAEARPITGISITNGRCSGVENGVYFFCYLAGCGYGNLAIANMRLDARAYAVKINTADSVTGTNTVTGMVYSGTMQLNQAQFWSVASNVDTVASATPTRTATTRPTLTRTPTPTTPAPLWVATCTGRVDTQGVTVTCWP